MESAVRVAFQPRAADAGGIECPRPRPAPLLVPTLALMGGIWMSAALGPNAAGLRTTLLLTSAGTCVLLLVASRRGPPWGVALAYAALTLIALAAGFERHQITLDRPTHHIEHVLTDEPVLTRLTGRLINAPTERPGTLYNPFLPFTPPPRTHFVLAVDELRTGDRPIAATGRVRVGVDAHHLGLRLGQRVQLTGRLYRPLGPRNPGAIDWSRWNRQQGIDAGMQIESAAHVVVLNEALPLADRAVGTLRAAAAALLLEPYADLETSEAARLLDVMILGQRSIADQKLNEAFLRAGGMHFLAVSGFNVAILAAACWWIARRVLRRGARTAALATLAVTALFALVTEPNAPILRAAICVGVASVGTLLRRPWCPINWLALSAACILIGNPGELFRPGFQLSFVQVLALFTVIPHVHRTLLGRAAGQDTVEAETLPQLVMRTARRWAVDLVIICLCAWLAALPLVVWHFRNFAPWGWLGTILLSPFVTLITIFSLFVFVARLVMPPLGALLAALLLRMSDVLLWLVGLFECLPQALVECQPPPLWLVFVTYGVLLGWTLLQRRGPPPQSADEPAAANRPWLSGARLLNLATAGMLGLAWGTWALWPAHGRPRAFGVHVLSVADGSAALVTTPSGQAGVIDVGTNTNTDAGEVAVRALYALGAAHVGPVIVSHANFDHYSGLPTLLRRTRIDRYYTSTYCAAVAAASDAGIDLPHALPPGTPPPQCLHAGDRLQLGNAVIEVLWPPAGLAQDTSPNDLSLVLRLTAGGRAVLFTADIERGALLGLLERERRHEVNLKADVLIAPHHGQVVKQLTADFVAAVAPRVVIVSTRTPRPRLRQLIAEVAGPATEVWLTGDVGAVSVIVEPDGRLAVQTPYAPHRTP